MPWWFWVILWTVIVLLSVTTLSVMAVRTGRRFLAAVREVEALGTDMTGRWGQGSLVVAQRIREAPLPGVLVPVRQAREDFVRGRTNRHERKVAQRIARRDRLGQPQRLGDLRRSGAQKGKHHG